MDSFRSLGGGERFLNILFNADTSLDYRYLIVNSVQMEQEINGKSFKSDSKIDAQYEFSLCKKGADTNTFRVNYNDFSISMAIDGIQVSANAKTAKYSSNPSIRVFSAFLETDFVYDLDSTGRILSASGMDDLTKRMIELGKNDQEVVQQIESYVKGLAGESLMKNSVLKAFNFLPRTPIYEGFEWTTQEPSVWDANVTLPMKHRVVEITEDEVIAVLDSDIELKDLQTRIQGNLATSSLKGKGKGKVSISTESGLILEYNLEVKLKGETTVLGRTIPSKIVSKNTIKRVQG